MFQRLTELYYLEELRIRHLKSLRHPLSRNELLSIESSNLCSLLIDNRLLLALDNFCSSGLSLSFPKSSLEIFDIF
jgi:hypothetical protein